MIDDLDGASGMRLSARGAAGLLHPHVQMWASRSGYPDHGPKKSFPAIGFECLSGERASHFCGRPERRNREYDPLAFRSLLDQSF